VEKPASVYQEQETGAVFEGFHQKGITAHEQSQTYNPLPEKIKNLEDDQGKILRADSPNVLGQVFGVFLIVQYQDNLYIIDQHAAHERLLYEELQNKEPVKQELLFPVAFDVTGEEEEQIKKYLPLLSQKGIQLEKAGQGCYEITALPAHFHTIDSKEIVEFLKNLGGATGELEHRLNSLAACRNAIKDGDTIDQLTAQTLVSNVFLLENARCPHGRPIWHMITKEQLYKLMGRK
jgi:DNA mismatch repair protein MutL